MKISSSMDLDRLMLTMGDSITRAQAATMRDYLVQYGRRASIENTDSITERDWLELCKIAVKNNKF